MLNQLIAWIKSFFPAPTVARIVANINNMITQLEVAVQHHTDQATIQGAAAIQVSALQAEHLAEVDLANSVKQKLIGLVTV